MSPVSGVTVRWHQALPAGSGKDENIVRLSMSPKRPHRRLGH